MDVYYKDKTVVRPSYLKPSRVSAVQEMVFATIEASSTQQRFPYYWPLIVRSIGH